MGATTRTARSAACRKNGLVFEFLQKNYRAFPKPVQEEIIAYMRDSSPYLDAKKAASYHKYEAELFCIYHPMEKESQQFLQGMENKDKAKYKLLLFEQLENNRDETALETIQLKGFDVFRAEVKKGNGVWFVEQAVVLNYPTPHKLKSHPLHIRDLL